MAGRFTSGLRGGTDNKEWITGDDIPDPAPNELPVVHGWNILLRPVKIREEIGDSGLYAPEVMRDDIRNLCNVGRVLAIGPRAYKDTDRTGPEPWVAVGDLVCFPRFTGARFLFRGIRMVLVEDTSMIMTIKDPSDIDPIHNLGE